MKVIIERHLQPMQFSVVKDSKRNTTSMFIEFNALLHMCTASKSLKLLAELMDKNITKDYFSWYFEISCMIVHQRDEFGNVMKDRLLIVTEE